MKKIMWLFLILVFGSYTACRWDYHLSSYLFDRYCSEEDRVGSFIYERIELGDEYFVPLPLNEEERRDVSQRYVFREALMIDLLLFEENYDVSEFRAVTPLSDIGPIVSISSSVIRKRDDKVLGKVVTLANHRGWWIDSSPFGGGVAFCPYGFNQMGDSNAGLAHQNLIKDVFHSNR